MSVRFRWLHPRVLPIGLTSKVLMRTATILSLRLPSALTSWVLPSRYPRNCSATAFLTSKPIFPVSFSATTEQAVIMLASHFYESRDGSTGGFFADNVQAGKQVWNTINLQLRLDRDWKVWYEFRKNERLCGHHYHKKDKGRRGFLGYGGWISHLCPCLQALPLNWAEKCLPTAFYSQLPIKRFFFSLKYPII